MRRHLSYANVTATIALVLAAGTGGAYAIGEIGSRQIKDNSIRSNDLRDGRAVKGRDVKRDSLGGREVDEGSLVGTRLLNLAADENVSCDPPNGTFIDCVTASLDFPRVGRAVVIATGGFASQGAPAKATCEVRVDGQDVNQQDSPGEETTNNTSALATDGFARTLVTDPLSPGEHNFALACAQLGADDARIFGSTIAVIAVSGN